MFSRMNRLSKYLSNFVLCSLFFGYGVASAHYQIFPYHQLIEIRESITSEPPSTERNREFRVQLFEKFAKKSDIVFVGDSLTEAGEWNEFLPGLSIANRGVTGDKTSDVLLRLKSINSTEADFVFLMLGINDIYNDVPLTETVENYKKIVSSLTDKGSRVFVQSTIQCAESRCGSDRIHRVNELNQKLSNISKDLDIDFVDLEELSQKNGLKAAYTYDGKHLSAVGYEAWVSKISEVLAGLHGNSV